MRAEIKLTSPEQRTASARKVARAIERGTIAEIRELARTVAIGPHVGEFADVVAGTVATILGEVASMRMADTLAPSDEDRRRLAFAMAPRLVVYERPGRPADGDLVEAGYVYDSVEGGMLSSRGRRVVQMAIEAPDDVADMRAALARRCTEIEVVQVYRPRVCELECVVELDDVHVIHAAADAGPNPAARLFSATVRAIVELRAGTAVA